MRAVIYTRVSSDPNETLRSVESQETECRQVAAHEGWTIADVFTDNDRSASRYATKTRPGYDALRDYLTAGRADVLLLWEGSRAQRDLREYLRLRDLCAERGILYCYSGKIHDLSRTDDRFTTGLDALLAERESDVTRDRVLRGVRASAAAGRPHGRLLYGYAREYDDGGRFVRQVERPDQAAIVREVARRVKGGELTNAIAVDLNARGVPAPRGGRWDLTQVRRLATNPGYAGQRVHRGQIIGPADWPPILDESTYATCVAVLSDPRRKTVRESRVRHLLSGVATCASCGAPLRVIKNRGYLAYACTGKFCVAVRTTRLENFVTRLVLAWLTRPDALAMMTPPDSADDAARAAAEATELRERLAGFYASAASGKLSPEGLVTIEARLLPQIADADTRARTLRVPPVLVRIAGPDPVAVWEAMTIAERRLVVELLVDLRVSRTVRGSRFDYRRLSESRWKGDSRTWGEIWAEEASP